MIMGSRAFGLAISFVTIAIVARLLSPRDYGLVAMVVSVTAFFTVFSDLGLSWVTVQRPDITKQQLSTLFWVNVAFGVLLGLITVALAPALTWL